MNKLTHRNKISGYLLAMLISALLIPSQNARALTFLLDFSTVNSQTITFSGPTIGVTNALDPTDFGLASGDFNSFTSSILNAVIEDYRGYPTIGTDSSSPIPVGRELDIDFEIATIGSSPTNGDTDYFFMQVGDYATSLGVSSGTLGFACDQCVRDSSGGGASTSAGNVIGTIFSDRISTLAGSFSLTQAINVLTGTISHEIGHALSLDHSGIAANPGESSYSTMATGASPHSMPNAQRLLDRDFSYTDMTALVTAVGLRDVSAVPLPPSIYLFGFSLLLLNFMKKRRQPTT